MTWPFTITDEQAMWRVQNADDHAAFARLVERWETPIQRLCARMTGDLHRAEDLAQEEARLLLICIAAQGPRSAGWSGDLPFSPGTRRSASACGQRAAALGDTSRIRPGNQPIWLLKSVGRVYSST